MLDSAMRRSALLSRDNAVDAEPDRNDIVHEARFRATGSDAHVIVVGADRARCERRGETCACMWSSD
jgi:hypothetical protein